jgi:hypothetical protein
MSARHCGRSYFAVMNSDAADINDWVERETKVLLELQKNRLIEESPILVL